MLGELPLTWSYVDFMTWLCCYSSTVVWDPGVGLMSHIMRSLRQHKDSERMKTPHSSSSCRVREVNKTSSCCLWRSEWPPVRRHAARPPPVFILYVDSVRGCQHFKDFSSCPSPSWLTRCLLGFVFVAYKFVLLFLCFTVDINPGNGCWNIDLNATFF